MLSKHAEALQLILLGVEIGLCDFLSLWGFCGGYKADAQRFALPACGRAWILFGSKKNSKREKCLKMPQNPTRQVHAMLARSYLINKLIIKFIMTDEITPRKKPKKQSRFFSLFTTFSFVV